MAKSVDNKVVEMTFNNSQFEKAAAQTLSTLDKLKAALKFDKAASGLNDVQKQLNNMDVKRPADEVENLGGRFSAMGAAALASMAAIGVAAVALSAKLAKTFTIDPMTAGFQEYETNINSVQTILANTASKGSTLDDVNEALDTLNEYSDQTIYNFSQMARNIGTFTAAGVDLETSASAIKGIANVAAVSGSSAEQASTAMYQLSQAIANGTVKLMDWNSVVNAGMGGEVFQKALFESGKAMKTLEGVPMGQTFEEWKKKGNSFRESLNEGWLTSEVLTNTLETFTGDLTEAQIQQMGYTKAQAKELAKMGQIAKAAASDIKTGTQFVQVVKESLQSGWASSFRVVIGDFNQAKQLFSGVGGLLTGWIKKQADSRNKMLNIWKIFGGRNTLFEGLVKSFQAVRSILDPIRFAFRTLFPKQTAKELLILTKGFRDFAEKLKMGGDGQKAMVKIFGLLFTVLKGGIQIFMAVFRAVKAVVGLIIKTVGGPLVSLIAAVAVGLTNLIRPFLGGGAAAVNVFAKAIEWLSDKLKGVGKWLTDAVVSVEAFFSGLGDVDVVGIVGEKVEKLKEELAKLAPIGDKIGETFDKVKTALVGAGREIKAFVGNLGGFDGATEKVIELWDSFTEKLDKGFGKDKGDKASIVEGSVGDASPEWLIQRWEAFLDTMSNIGDRLKEAFQATSEFLNDIIDQLGSGVSSIGELIGAALASDSFDKLLKAGGLGAIVNFLLTLRRFSKEGIKFDFMGGESARVFGEVGDALKAFQTKVKAEALRAIAIAVAILVASLVVLALIPAEKMSKGLSILGGMLAALTASLILMDKGLGTGGKALAMAGVLIGLGAALLLMSIALAAIGALDIEQIAKGMFGVIGSLVGLSLAMKLMPPGVAAQQGLALLLVAYSLKQFAAAIKLFTDISWLTMIEGLVFIVGFLAAMAGALHLFPDDLIQTAVGLLIVSGSLMVIAEVLKRIGQLSVGQLVASIAALGATLFILALAMEIFGMPEVAAGMTGMIVAAAAMLVIAAALTVLADLSIANIVTGLVAIVSVFVILGAAALIMGPVIPILALLGIALLVAGAGFLFFGAGMLLAAVAIREFADAGEEGFSAFMRVLDMVVTALPRFATAFALAVVGGIEAFLQAIPQLAEAAGTAISAILGALTSALPALFTLIAGLLDGFITLVREYYPQFILLGLEILMALLDGLANNIEPIVTAIGTFIVNLLNGLAEQLPAIIEAGVNLLVSFLSGLTEGTVEIANAVSALILTLIYEIGLHATEIVDAAAAMLAFFLAGFTDNATEVIRAVGDLITDVIDALADEAVRIAEAGTDAIVEFLAGMRSTVQRVTNAVTLTAVFIISTIAQGILDAVTTATTTMIDIVVEFLDELGQALRDGGPRVGTAIRGFAEDFVAAIVGGIRAAVGDIDWFSVINDAAGGLFGAFLDAIGANSPSKLFRKGAIAIPQGIALGIKDGKPMIEESVKSIGQGLTAGLVNNVDEQAKTLLDSVAATLSTIPALLAEMDDLNPTITPVLDMRQVEKEAGKVAALVGTAPIEMAINPEASYVEANTIAGLRVDAEEETAPTQTETQEVTFVQNNYSPKALSTADIYRGTKSQLAVAREELKH
jgi:tape measure domain-containing protein